MNIIETLIEATKNDEIKWIETSSYLSYSTRFKDKHYLISQYFDDTSIYEMNECYDFIGIDEFHNTDVLKKLYSIIMDKYPLFRQRVLDCLRNIREREAEDEHCKKKINITPELTDRIDGRCFLDLDMNDRIEAFRFIKTSTGIDMVSVGCNDHWGYSHLWHDDYGEYEIGDTFCGIWIDMVETNCYLVREISQEKFDKANIIVNDIMENAEKRLCEFKKRQKEFGLLRE